MAYSALSGGDGTPRLGLALVSSGGPGKIYHYSTPDARAVVVAANYFLSDWQKFNVGDIIHVRAVVGGTEVFFDLAIATSTSAAVTVLSGASFA